MMAIVKPATLRTPEAFRSHVQRLGVELDVDDTVLPSPESPLGRPMAWEQRRIGNRFAILPMEGWDGTTDGRPTDLVIRRWRRFGSSGAKLIWGGEAFAVRDDGRANPNQLVFSESNTRAMAELREGLVQSHREAHGDTTDLVIGAQLTHSGRFARPSDKRRMEPMRLYAHPLLDARYHIDPATPVISDGQIDDLIADYVKAAVRAARAGFDFVDLKHCHGYLGHEFLSAVRRPGRYGGSFENRTRFLREIVAGIRRDAPGLGIGVRLSLYDQRPFQPGVDRVGVPSPWDGPYPFAFGADPEKPEIILWDEPLRFLQLLQDLNIHLVCLSCGSPYYNPHIQRPAAIPPSDGYLPPEDPMVGVARQIESVGRAKAAFPNLIMVGSGYSYLQEWLPAVAQAQVRLGHVDFIGLGRMVLSYPELPADVLAGRTMDRRRICRTFSECTTGPRNGWVSGCFPLDDFYRNHPDAARLKELLRQ